MELRHPRAQALSGVLAAGARVALLVGPTVLGFVSGGYFERERLIAAIVAWVLVALLAVITPGPILPRTAAARLAIAGLALYTLWALWSTTWAPLSGPAGEDVQRDALYVAVLIAGVLAWRPRDWARAVEPALAAGIVIVVGYGVLGRLIPGLLHEHASFYAGGRLDQPLTYWNAMGAVAAIGIVLCVRLAGDRLRPEPARALAAAGGVLLGLGLYLTYSRGALAAVGCGLIVLLLLAPSWGQARALTTVVVGGALVALVGSQLDGVASLKGSMGHREAQGALMLAVLVVVMLAAAAIRARTARAPGVDRVTPLAGGAPRIAGWLAAIALALVPFAAAVVSERGPEGDNPTFGASASRFGSVGSNRYTYWRVTLRTFADHPLKGTGTGSFRVDWLRERPFRESVRDAHSLYFETLAELGIVGFVLLCALLAGVLLAVVRALDADPVLATGPVAALVVWAVHAGVDWDWEMPAVTLLAVTLAGMLLARGEAGARPRPPG